MRPYFDKSAMMMAWVVLGLAGCQARDTLIGSACPDGVCLQTDDEEGPACLASNWTMNISAESPGLEHVCLPRRLPVDNLGLVACRVVVLTMEAERSCSERSFSAWGDPENRPYNA